MWKTRGKKGLILLDFSTIHRVFHKVVENSPYFPTGQTGKISLGKITKKCIVYNKTRP